jgi:hypothetical protein
MLQTLAALKWPVNVSPTCWPEHIPVAGDVRVPAALLPIEQIGIEPGARAVVVRPPEGLPLRNIPLP